MVGFLRRLYLKRILKRVKQVGANVFVHESTEIYAPELLEIGDYVHIQQGCKLFADGGGITIWRRNHIFTRYSSNGKKSCI